MQGLTFALRYYLQNISYEMATKKVQKRNTGRKKVFLEASDIDSVATPSNFHLGTINSSNNFVLRV